MQDNQLNDQNLMASLVHALLKEKRSDRRWKNFRFIIVMIFFVMVGIGIYSSTSPTISEGDGGKGYVALIRLEGMIAPGENFSAEQVLPLLKEAFKDPEAKGIILDINSGGGTPVQASIIHDAIVSLKKQYNKKVIVVGEDMLASGAYFVAVAGDKIYVNPNTITGSIGVIMKGFGYTDLIKKIGVERRVYTAGINKDRLDPFMPQQKQDIEKIQTVIKEVHDNFIQTVMDGRKGKLHGDEKELFSGDFWSGQTAFKLGLVDGLGNLSDVMKNEFHVSRYKDYANSNAMLSSLVGKFGMSLGTALMSDQIHMVETL